MKDFRNLMVWEKSHRLTLAVYAVTKAFPREELFGLTSQIRRSCSSIPANIAEGCGKSTDPDFAKFLQTAFGSASELEYHLLLAHDLRLIDPTGYAELNSQLLEIKRMLSALMGKIRNTADLATG